MKPRKGCVTKPLVEESGTEGGDSSCVLVSHEELLFFACERLQNDVKEIVIIFATILATAWAVWCSLTTDDNNRVLNPSEGLT